jgi:hypothetical protein
MKKFQYDDFYAFLVMVGCLILIGKGADGTVTSVLTMTAGYMFGKNSGKNR